MPLRDEMKSYNYLFEKIVDFENFITAAKNTQKGKRLRASTSRFNFFLERELLKLQSELQDQAYRPGKYRQFYVYEPKSRLISAAPYRDRVVHHAFCNVIEPIFDSRFIYHSYACRKGKGTHQALDCCQEFLHKNKYVLKCDIRQYFASINHGILLKMLSARIKDKKVLWLAELIIRSADGLKANLNDKKEVVIKGTGLPIGNLTSQFFANLYLNELDYFVKFNLRMKYYLRYMDDFLIFDNDKKFLHNIKEEIRCFLEKNLKLHFHPEKSKVFPVKSGVTFCGFRIFEDYRKLKKSNVRMFIGRMKHQQELFKQGRIRFKDISSSLRCWIAHASHGNSYGLRKKMFRIIFSGL